MPDLVLREVPQQIVEELNRRAGVLGRTPEAEHLEILKAVLRPRRSDFRERAAALREKDARTKVHGFDSPDPPGP